MSRSIAIFFIILGLPLTLWAGPPLPYSGTLNDGGAPFDGIVNMRISLYEAEGDEIPLWFETHDGVQINGGQFNLNLFSQTDINDHDLGLQQIYVGVSINDGSELLPRRRLGIIARARVALQALDILGRDVNPASVSVNGNLVINNEGQWVGPAGDLGNQGESGPAR